MNVLRISGNVSGVGKRVVEGQTKTHYLNRDRKEVVVRCKKSRCSNHGVDRPMQSIPKRYLMFLIEQAER